MDFREPQSAPTHQKRGFVAGWVFRAGSDDPGICSGSHPSAARPTLMSRPLDGPYSFLKYRAIGKSPNPSRS
jgi:hypothetical protein